MILLITMFVRHYLSAMNQVSAYTMLGPKNVLPFIEKRIFKLTEKDQHTLFRIELLLQLLLSIWKIESIRFLYFVTFCCL